MEKSFFAISPSFSREFLPFAIFFVHVPKKTRSFSRDSTGAKGRGSTYDLSTCPRGRRPRVGTELELQNKAEPRPRARVTTVLGE